ncbi:FUSC family protein [Georgenia satyanarayanai]|uniref:FUSC family protein n=1 Tax=Georgenia satyanarayanai TaxID=860221 RepID=UPI00203D4B33|nr:FUSC family protein [Georgenia satyanarayanai]MCM3660225.1 FUSC family protein [Georgenia satyanarayanai]
MATHRSSDRPARRRHPLCGLRWTVRPPSRWQVAVRASVAIGAPVTTMTLLGDQPAGLLMGTGAFTVLYAAGRPWRSRLRLLLGVAASFVLCACLGTLASGSAPASVALVVGVATVATFLCHSLRVGVPGAFFFVLVAGLGGYLPMHGVAPAGFVISTAVGAAFAVVVAMADLAVRPHGPQRDAVARARAAVDAFLSGPRAGEEAYRRSAAAGDALHHGWATLADGRARGERADALLAELGGVQRAYSAHLLPGDAPDPELAAEQAEAPLGRPTARQLLRHAARWPSNPLQATVRVAVGVAAAGLLASALDVDHVYWTMAATMLVLHTGLDRRGTAVRAAHRLVGTVVGLGIFLLVHVGAADSPWLVVAVVVLLQGLVELFVARAYAVAVVFITPLALTIGTAGTDLSVTPVVSERLLDTAVGVVIGALVPWVVLARGAPRLLAACIARVLVAVATAVEHLGAGTHRTSAGRHALRDLALTMQEMSAAAGRTLRDDPAGVAPLLALRESTAWLGLTVLARGAVETTPASHVEGAAWACRVLARRTAAGDPPEPTDVYRVRAAVAGR